MDRRLISGSLAALAAVALVSVGVSAGPGATDAAFDDRADVPGNVLAAGALTLDLSGDGSATAQLTFADLVPGSTSATRVWVATNDSTSTPAATLALTLRDLRDVPAPCALSRGKALGEIASGVTGCSLGPAGPSGTPAQGNLSRLLDLGVTYDPDATDPATCATVTSGQRLETFPRGPGNLRSVAGSPAGTTARLRTPAGDDLRLAPGQGVCLSVVAVWQPAAPADPSPEHPLDDAAQGDTLTVQARFDLEQVQS